MSPIRKQVFASDALSLLTRYCFEALDLHQLFANITSDNKHSITLFTNNGFKKCGEKKTGYLLMENIKLN